MAYLVGMGGLKCLGCDVDHSSPSSEVIRLNGVIPPFFHILSWCRPYREGIVPLPYITLNVFSSLLQETAATCNVRQNPRTIYITHRPKDKERVWIPR